MQSDQRLQITLQYPVITAQDAREARGEGSPGEYNANIAPAELTMLALSGLGVT